MGSIYNRPTSLGQPTTSWTIAKGVAARVTPQTPAETGSTQIGTYTMQPSTLLTQPRDRPYNERLEVHTSIASHLLESSGIPSPSSGRSAKPSRIGAAISSAHAQNWQVAQSPPPSTTVPSNRPTPQPSGNPQRPHAVGKPLHLGVIRGGPERLCEHVWVG